MSNRLLKAVSPSKGWSLSSVATAVASVPILIWTHDTFLSLYRVNGSSMEPSLHHGDIVVVRKSDGFWQRWTRKTEDLEVSYERQRQLDWERMHCSSGGTSLLVHKPPMPVAGDIIVYNDQTEYPPRCNIKRLVGVGGQVVMVPAHRCKNPPKRSSYQMDAEIARRRFERQRQSNKEQDTNKDDTIEPTPMVVGTTEVPPYSLWVEGDNAANSKDSKSADASGGPICKKLLVGIAEYRIWPPTRIGKLDGTADKRQGAQSYAYTA